ESPAAGAAVTEPASHPVFARACAAGVESLAHAEDARRSGDVAHAPEWIVRRSGQAEQLRVRQDPALGVDVPRDGGVRTAVAVEIDGFAIEIDVDVARPGDV